MTFDELPSYERAVMIADYRDAPDYGNLRYCVTEGQAIAFFRALSPSILKLWRPKNNTIGDFNGP